MNTVKAVCSLGVVVCLALFMAMGCSKPTTETGQKTCPVVAGEANPKIFVEHEGRKIYFCSESCKEEFAKDSKKYVAIVDKELKKIAEEVAAPKKAE